MVYVYKYTHTYWRNMVVNILGTEYTITESTEIEDETLQSVDGYCDTSIKSIVVDKMENLKGPGLKKNLGDYKKSVIRHEITHAYLYESGLAENSWAKDEELVDWMAIQIPKMARLFQEIGVF